MATTPDLQEPQIAAARAQAWHQTGEALLTLEAARSWLQDFGIVPFAPRGASLGAPAPSLVEATLGTSKAAATLADSDVARTLTARLVGEGSALPLNLLGGPGDLPDFLVSAQAFPFVFTLRGDKGWKRAPETSGAVKVTPLGLAVYELLAEKGSLTVAEIVSEVGREVTESAIARALSELWQILRVIPVLQQGEGETRWELITARFLKAVKAGANAGQPTALSALVSLYLAQVYVASEEEVAGFLSPLTGRARVREVLHGLTAGRQLAEAVVNGKTVVYVPDALPDFAAFAEPEPEQAEGTEALSKAVTDGQAVEGTPRERIRRFDQGTVRGNDRNLRGKPVRRDDSVRPARPARDDRGGAGRGERGGFAPRTGRPAAGGFTRKPREDRGGETGERRPYAPRTDRPARPAREGGERSTFDRRPKRGEGEGFERRPAAGRSEFARPWDEERAARPPRGRAAEGERSSDDRAARPPRPRRDEGDDRPARPFRARDDSRPPRRDADDRPSFRRREQGSSEGGERRPSAGGDRPARPFRPRTEGEGRPFRPRTEGSARPARPRAEGGDRPYRPRTEGGDRPYRPRTEGGDRSFRPRPDRGAEGAGSRERRGPGGLPSHFGGTDRPARPRREDSGGEGRGERPAGRGRPPFGGGRSSEPRAPRGDRPQGRSGDRPSFRPGPRPGGGAGFRSGPKKGPGTKSTDRPSGPARGPRPPRREDEA